MLTTDTKAATVMHNEKDKLWGVKRGTPQYAGWCNWYYYGLGKKFFPEWLTVPFEWPPTTETGCEMATKWLSDIRDQRDEAGKVINSTPVRSNPAPWRGAKDLPPSPPCMFPEKKPLLG